MKPPFFFACFLSCLSLAACAPATDTRPGQPVAHRQQAFREILKSFEPMGMALRENRYDPETFLRHARALEQQKDAPWPYFGPETNYPPTRSKNAVWSEAALFASERDAFLQAVTRLRQAAETRDEAQARPAYEAVHERCRVCHKAFKSE
ncbi:MAG: cytochrome c [Zoogloeaceae bacterium]|jgi:cytochrome c556|nr:cytochrome c [Zoogloeaceae bacterium]